MDPHWTGGLLQFLECPGALPFPITNGQSLHHPSIFPAWNMGRMTQASSGQWVTTGQELAIGRPADHWPDKFHTRLAYFWYNSDWNVLGQKTLTRCWPYNEATEVGTCSAKQCWCNVGWPARQQLSVSVLPSNTGTILATWRCISGQTVLGQTMLRQCWAAKCITLPNNTVIVLASRHWNGDRMWLAKRHWCEKSCHMLPNFQSWDYI